MRDPGPLLIVHVLYHGLALCGLDGIPRDWPEGHKWVPIGDLKNCNCPGCKEPALRLRKEIEDRDAQSAARSSRS